MFYQHGQVVVLKEGLELARYESVAQFVAAHEDGLAAIDREQVRLEDLLLKQYAPKLD